MNGFLFRDDPAPTRGELDDRLGEIALITERLDRLADLRLNLLAQRREHRRRARRLARRLGVELRPSQLGIEFEPQREAA